MQNPKSVEQLEAQFQSIRSQLLTQPQFFAASGAVVADFRTRDGRRFGPYYRVAFRQNGRQRSIYLGPSQPLADRVANLLAELKRPTHQHRAVRRLRTRLRAELRAQKSIVERELAPHGFHMRGFAAHRKRHSLPRVVYDQL
jgi:hypothetical protein